MRKLLPCLLLVLVALPAFAVTDVYSARYEERGRVLVEMRPIFEALSASVEWIAASQQIRARYGTQEIMMQINNPQAYVDGRAVLLDVPPRLVKASTRVPLRFVAETFGATVAYEITWVRIVTPDQRVLIVHLGDGSGARTGTTGGFTRPNRPLAGQWPWTSTRQVTIADLSGQSNWTLTLMRSEIEARKGKLFSAAALRNYFGGQTWYEQNPAYRDAMLTALERQNYDAILQYQRQQFGQPAYRP